MKGKMARIGYIRISSKEVNSIVERKDTACTLFLKFLSCLKSFLSFVVSLILKL